MNEKKFLIVGANGYVGSRLTYKLAEEGHDVIALVRSKDRFHLPKPLKDKVQVIECDLLDNESLKKIPKDIECAYYLVHSMSSAQERFFDLEKQSALNFVSAIEKTEAKMIVYLSGLSVGKEKSQHMKSRNRVSHLLSKGKVPVVTLKAGIIIGSGGASFELMRDLVEKLPLMIAPKWVSSKCQPIGINDVLYYLENLHNVDIKESVIYQIGGPDILTYKEMLYRFAKIRKLKRFIISIPFLTPRLSSFWLFFITSNNLYLSRRLVESLKTDAICTNNDIEKILPHKCLNYEETIIKAFDKIEQNHVLSSWKDALNVSRIKPHLDGYINVPEHGCLKNIQTIAYNNPKAEILDRLWSIGGKNGWYYMDWAWHIRGRIDKIFGGVGLRRGRRSPTDIENGDSLDFWRVIKANKEDGHLLLFAEMKVPGEAWLEWFVYDKEGKVEISQVATFRPKGVFGRLYWYSLWPVHIFIFRGLCNKIGKGLQ